MRLEMERLSKGSHLPQFVSLLVADRLFASRTGNAHHSLKSREIDTVRYDAVQRISYFLELRPPNPGEVLYTNPPELSSQ
jgi:hypothetical protein